MKRVFVIAGPSGVGKSHLIEELVERHPYQMYAPKLTTTRQPRQGERAIDREFVSPTEFEVRQAAGQFALIENFDDSLYGYSAAALEPTDKHHLLNVTPGAVTQVRTNCPRVLIGMTVQADRLEMLQSRMNKRGDTPERRAERTSTIHTDLADLEANRALFEQEGRIFDVRDDQTVESIIHWVEASYLTEEA